jgi:hypothetical protein
MTRCWLFAEQIDEGLVDQFLDSHLPCCDCHASALRTHGDLRASLGHLRALLREQHVIVELSGPSGPTAEELSRYNVHMRDARGRAIGTREGRLAIVSRLLSTLSSHWCMPSATARPRKKSAWMPRPATFWRTRLKGRILIDAMWADLGLWQG